jgi:acetaldehyde dehydrogenase (acetylating)
MNEIIITTQEELDKLTDFKEQIAIIIKGNIYRLSRNVKNGLYSVSGNATVQYVYGNATVQSVSDNATVKYVSDNATVQSVSGNATVQSVSDNATVQYVSGNATVKILSDSVTGAASGRAVIILQDCSPKIIISGHATLVNTIAQKHTKESFLNTFIPDDKGFVYLYKSVNSNTRCDFKTGKIKYEGMVTCPYFDPSEDRKC